MLTQDQKEERLKYIMVKLRDVPDDSFVNFISQCLEWDPTKRLTPEQGLRHEWVLKGLPPNVLLQHQKVQNIGNNELPESARQKVPAQNKSIKKIGVNARNQPVYSPRGRQPLQQQSHGGHPQQLPSTEKSVSNSGSLLQASMQSEGPSDGGKNLNHKQLLRRLIAK